MIGRFHATAFGGNSLRLDGFPPAVLPLVANQIPGE